MVGTTAWVRQALQGLGADASDVEVKAYIREKAPSVPESQVGLALRKIRGRVVPARQKGSPPKAEGA
jgi:hypothetical protein